MRIIAAYRSPPRASIFTHETHDQGEPAMSKPKLAIVIGSTRLSRFGGHAAADLAMLRLLSMQNLRRSTEGTTVARANGLVVGLDPDIVGKPPVLELTA